MKIRDNYTCPLEFVHDIIKGKWKTIIIFTLRHGSMSLADLEKSIQGISQKMLLQHLNELRTHEIIEKKTYEGYPLKVEYFLTDELGADIIEAINLMQRTGIKIMVKEGNTKILDEKGIDYSWYH